MILPKLPEVKRPTDSSSTSTKDTGDEDESGFGQLSAASEVEFTLRLINLIWLNVLNTRLGF